MWALRQLRQRQFMSSMCFHCQDLVVEVAKRLTTSRTTQLTPCTATNLDHLFWCASICSVCARAKWVLTNREMVYLVACWSDEVAFAYDFTTISTFKEPNGNKRKEVIVKI